MCGIPLDSRRYNPIFNYMVKYSSSREAAECLDRVFHALADPTRRAILTQLADGPAVVGELAQPFSMSLPAVSKHLAVLERARLMARDRDGRFHRCRLEPEPMAGAAEWIARTRAFWEGRLDGLSRYLEPKGAKEG